MILHLLLCISINVVFSTDVVLQESLRKKSMELIHEFKNKMPKCVLVHEGCLKVFGKKCLQVPDDDTFETFSKSTKVLQSCFCDKNVKSEACRYYSCTIGKNDCPRTSTCVEWFNGKGYCQCNPGYYGRDCSHSFCEEFPYYCENGGRCKIDENGKPSCACKIHYDGDHCENHICDISNNCETAGCKSPSKVCKCKPGWEGHTCKDAICAEPGYCHNRGTCITDVEKPYCRCVGGYTGDFCEDHYTKKIGCLNGGRIISSIGRSTACDCLGTGFTGKLCETAVCSVLTCLNGGKCLNWNDHPSCRCYGGYSGDRCQHMICVNGKSCENDGRCVEKDGKKACLCSSPDIFTGDNCELYCESPCIQGTCTKNEDGSTRCLCDTGYTGDTCGEKIPEK